MQLSAPQKITWWIALIAGVVGIIAHLFSLPIIGAFGFWLLAAAFVLLVVATLLKGL